MSMTTVAPAPAVPGPVIAGHPRGRGFGILSRLARTDDRSGRHVREDGAADEHHAVLTFDRKHQSPQHRRDDARTPLSVG